jgi:hypothetical protein
MPARNRRAYRRAGGVALPKNLDGRSATGRRFKSLVAHYSEILGDSKPSEADASLIRRCAAQTIRLEELDIERMSGKPIDEDLYVRLSGELRRGESILGRLSEVL